MKKFQFTFILLFLLNIINAQTVPLGFNYQGIARDASNQIMANKPIKLEIAIINANIVEYRETHEDTTSMSGVFNVIVGKGQTNNVFESLKWGEKDYKIRTRIDLNDNNGWQNAGESPLMTVPYAMYALKSADGGIQGPEGEQGPAGPPNDLSIGTVTSGQNPSASITGIAPQQTLNLVLPKGDPGSQGPPNSLTIGTVTSGQNASASITGNAPQQTLNLILPQGMAGSQGPIGPAGPPNNLSIGNVTSGQNASATITDIAPQQKLNLVLPQGPKGDKGDPGEPSNSIWTEVSNFSERWARYDGNGIRLAIDQVVLDTIGLSFAGLCSFNKSGINVEQGFTDDNFNLGLVGLNFWKSTSESNYSNGQIDFNASGNSNNPFYLRHNQSNKIGVFANRVEFTDGLKIGNSTFNQAGTIRFNGSDLEGYVGGQWKSLTSGGSGDGITGSGTSGYISRFTGTTALANSGLFQASNGNIGIGTTSPAYLLDVRGAIRSNGLSELSSVNGVGTVTTYGPNGSINVRLSSPSFNNNYGGMSINDNNGNTRVINSINSLGVGWTATYGSNGNSNVVNSNLENYPNNGFVSVRDESNTTRAGIYVNSNGTGSIYTVGTNDNYNTIIGSTNSNNNNGAVQVCNINGSVRAEMITDNAGNGDVSIFDSGGNFKGGFYINNLNQSIVTANLKQFQMVDPIDNKKIIAYTSLEGPEAGAYERGVAQLNNGEIFVLYSDHFKKVINPNTVTIILTPQSIETYGLAVVEKKATGFVVKELMHGKGNFSFDWEVKGVRKGYEDYQVVRDNDPQLLKKANQPEAVQSAQLKME